MALVAMASLPFSLLSLNPSSSPSVKTLRLASSQSFSSTPLSHGNSTRTPPFPAFLPSFLLILFEIHLSAFFLSYLHFSGFCFSVSPFSLRSFPSAGSMVASRRGFSVSDVRARPLICFAAAGAATKKKADSADKRARQSVKRRLYNKSRKSEIRTRMKKACLSCIFLFAFVVALPLSHR